MDELWQLYDERGEPINGNGGTKDEIFGRGLLHGAAHVWIWRKIRGDIEVLLQKRAARKRTWPNRYDISAAGHIDLGETPLVAALREAKEEINLEITKADLNMFGVHRAHLKAENGAIENEFQWLYSLEISNNTAFSLQESEVASLLWIPLNQFSSECMGDNYVPHGKLYYDAVTQSVESAANFSASVIFKEQLS